MIVDVACDEAGAVETCHDTCHTDPIYYVDGVMHYCVDNIPSAFGQTASTTLWQRDPSFHARNCEQWRKARH